MSWISEDNLHEGYLVPQFLDGQRGYGITGGSIPRDRVVTGVEVQADDGTWSYPTRPSAEVIAWVVCCDCSTPSSFGRVRTWTGPTFTRVPSRALENLGALRIFADDVDVPYVGERADVGAAAHGLWRSEHVFELDTLQELESAAQAERQAALRLETAVTLARGSGASWAAIGQSLGVSRQSAHERWRHLDGAGT